MKGRRVLSMKLQVLPRSTRAIINNAYPPKGSATVWRLSVWPELFVSMCRCGLRFRSYRAPLPRNAREGGALLYR